MFTIVLRRTGKELKNMFGEFDSLDDDTTYNLKFKTKNLTELNGVMSKAFEK